jgi:uncharacterized protein YqgV (UPF0045/DUF77 family)
VEVTFQVSLYPIAKKDLKTPINNFISELKKEQLDVMVHETSTIGSGDIEILFDTLKKAYSSAAKQGDTVMVLTVVNGSLTKEELRQLNKE